MMNRQVKHGMVFNHCMHSARWFWVRGMKKRAVAQFFVVLAVTYVSTLCTYYAVAVIEERREKEHYGLNS